MATGHSSFDKLASSTLRSHGKEIFDAISTNNAAFFLLKKKGNIKVTAGGREFTHPVRFRTNTGFRTYNKLEAIDTDLQDNVTRAVYPIKIAAGPLVTSKLEIAMNAGSRERLFSLMEEVKQDAIVSMSELMGDQVWNDGSAARDFDGLAYLINSTPDTQTDVGGITGVGNVYWRNEVDSTGTATFNTSQAGLTIMNNALLDCTFGAQGPNAVFTTKAIYSLYELGLTSNIRYRHDDLADSVFAHLIFATMPLLFDDNIPAAGQIYYVDMDQLWLQVLSQGNMEQTRFEPSHNQLSDIALMYIFGNLTTGSRRTNALITGITG